MSEYNRNKFKFQINIFLCPVYNFQYHFSAKTPTQLPLLDYHDCRYLDIFGIFSMHIILGVAGNGNLKFLFKEKSNCKD